MTQNDHEQARQLIVLAEGLSDMQRQFLQAHLADCADCRNYAAAAAQVVGALHSVPITADARLVRATQMRVRFHAQRLRHARQRMWFVGIACLGVGLSAAITAPLLWRLFAWMGDAAGVSSAIWQAGFMVFFFAPALLVSVLLLARGTVLENNRDRSQPWS